jgi:glycosyltransferase involved in cell wall biosynthesis
VVVPRGEGTHIGEAVYQTKEGASFRICELKEYSRLYVYSSYRGLAKLLIREKPDIIITLECFIFGLIFNIPVMAIIKALGIKLILKSIPFRLAKYEDAKGQLGRKSRKVEQLPRLFRSIVRGLGIEKFAKATYLFLRKFSFNIVDAHVNYVEDAFEIYGSYGVPKEKIFITYNSPDTDFLREIEKSLNGDERILPENQRRMVHIGRLVDWKRVDLLISAFSRIKKEFEDAELLVIGSGPLEKELKDLAGKLGVSDSIPFLGSIYNAKLLGKYLKCSTVYILAGMGGLSINDAMFFQLPIICSVCDGTEKKLVREGYNGLYFKEGSEDDLVDKIRYLFSNSVLRRQMGINSRKIIDEEINIHTVVKGYMDAFLHVMGSGDDEEGCRSYKNV